MARNLVHIQFKNRIQVVDCLLLVVFVVARQAMFLFIVVIVVVDVEKKMVSNKR